MVVFQGSTIPFQNIDRTVGWRHADNSIVGGLPKSQFLGKESEKLIISGDIYPEIVGGGEMTLRALESMAESGGSFPYITGNFGLEGFFCIEKITSTSTILNKDGSPRKISFTIELKRTDDSMAINIANAIMSGL